ncbi:fasciclin domain-containing protein [Gaetbulibacter sp. M240]|uniref:fasciclin domain-containing protein n=1 Tax=Gaetbulibacter sp. M240 TaxID=3126511 RepID=UPI00374ED179
MNTIKLSKNRPNLFKLPLLMISFLLMTLSCSKESISDAPVNEVDPSITEILASFNNTAKHGKEKSDDNDVWETDATFEILSVALAKTKLSSVVSKNRLTLLAPTDEAFMAAGITKQSVADIPNIENILLYHVLPQPVYSYDLSSGPATTAEGTDVIVSLSDSGVMINDAQVTTADISARNGVIHVIDKVLMIPSGNLVETALSQAPEFSILVEAASKAGLAETLATGGPFTVFAPTNQAFLDLLEATPYTSLDDIPVDMLQQILLYHVLGGYTFSAQLTNGYATTLNGAAVNVDLGMAPEVYINDSKVLATDVQATNGLIHVIDKVLLPPTMNLVEIAASYENEFTVLLAAATKAGLGDVLMGNGPYPQLTVFAPTDQAFINFLNVANAEEAIAAIETLNAEDLAPILLYHVVEGRVYSSDLASGPVTTLNGDFDLDLSTLSINGTVNLVPELLNVQATNGVIHVINGVLTP